MCLFQNTNKISSANESKIFRAKFRLYSTCFKKVTLPFFDVKENIILKFLNKKRLSNNDCKGSIIK